MRNNFKGKESKRKKAKNNNCVETRFDKKELMKINDVGNITYLGYSAEEFETYVINDPYNSIETHSSYSTNGLKVEIDEDWGEIDFDYKYKENE